MSDLPDDLRICPHCGQENASHTMRCIRCGQELEELFELEGFEGRGDFDAGSFETEPTPFSEALASLDESPLLSDPDEEESALDMPVENTGDQQDANKDSPDWLERIRQRAKEEEDASGELAKVTIASEDRSSEEGRKQVDEAFNDILRRIREQNEREKARRTRQIDSELVDENGDPEWLRRIRELHPDRETDSKIKERNEAVKDASDDEWTEEELQELLRREMGLPETSDDEPEEEITTEVVTPSPIGEVVDVDLTIPIEQVVDAEPEQAEAEPEITHNIPDDEEEGFAGGDEVDPSSEVVEAAILTVESVQTEDNLQLETGSQNEETLIEGETEKSSEEKVAESEDEDSPETEEPTSSKDVLPDLLFLKNQRERAQVFSEILAQEGRRTIPVLHERSRQSNIGRLVLGLLLVVGVLLAILVGPSGPVGLPLSAPAAAFAENLDSLSSGEAVLIILDYQAATRNDIEPLAEHALAILEAKGSKLRIVTSNPENIWLAGSLLGDVQVPDEFIPGGILGYLALATGSTPNWGELPIDLVFNGNADLFGGVDQVILVSDSAEFVRMWLEQISPWQPNIKTSAITTSLSAPILLPYHESGQLTGFVAGFVDAKALNVAPENLVNQRAYQVGILLMIMILLLGMIMKADEDTQRRSEERKQ